MKTILTIAGAYALLFILSVPVAGQVVTISPAFATQDDNVTVTFDAALGNAALNGQSTVYAHTGVITNLSSSATAWRYVQGNWGTDDSRVKMTNIGGNKFQLSYNIKQFYGVPAGEQVKKLAFVFRNQNGSLVGRNTDGGDIFVDLSDGAFKLLLSTNPSGNPVLLHSNENLQISISTPAKSTYTYYVDDVLTGTYTDTTAVVHTLAASQFGYGKHKFSATTVYNGTTYRDSLYFIVRTASASNVANPPAGVVNGINYINDSTVVLQLFAPQKNYVYVIGDFNNWQLDPSYEMSKNISGNTFWLMITGLEKGKEYAFQYSIDKQQLRVADPYADKLLDPDNDRYIAASTYPQLMPYPQGKTSYHVSVLQTGQEPYNWQYSNGFIRPNPANAVVYELHIRDFIGKHDYATLKDTLDYLQRLGVNVIELMPVNEFEGNESWGYNTIFYFAPDKYYGHKNTLKAFIDECHRRGMAVVLDMVLNHSFGQSSMVRMYFDNVAGKPLNSPWFNADATHPYNVGYDFNHESVHTQALVDTVIRYWIREYKVDGYRFDLSKGFTQTNNPNDVGRWSAYDQSRINIWKRIYNEATKTCADCYYILEHFADNTEEKVLADYGFMLWGNINGQFNEATMGYTSDLSWASYKNRGWSKPNLVMFAESHDEERLMYKNINYGGSSGGYNVKDTITALRRMEASAAMLTMIPGPHMIWQFGELGYDYSIDYNGRLGNKPIRWDYMQQKARRRLYDVNAALNKLKTSSTAFVFGNAVLGLTGSFKTIVLNDTSLNVVVAANFGLAGASKTVNLPHTGRWYNYITGDSIWADSIPLNIALGAGGYLILTDKHYDKPAITPVTGLSAYTDNSFAMYPNPANNMLFIASDEPVKYAEVYDITGKLMLTEKGENITQINISNLMSGYYLIRINTLNGVVTKKLIINN